jgi:predicted site-specific integrase-resolvase
MPIHFAIQEIGVSRTTMYNWMQRELVHWLELPSGRPMICEQSLMHRKHKARNITYDVPKGKPKPPKKPPRTA